MSELITVLLPVHNGEKFLKHTIDSILNQSYQNFEFLIINDGSEDQSQEIIVKYKDSRISYIENNENLGLISTLNKGIQASNGKLIARIDADDVSHQDRLKIQYEFMSRHPEVGVCGSFINKIDTLGNKIRTNVYPETHEQIKINLFLNERWLVHPTVIYRRELFINNNIWYNSDYIYAEDLKLWCDLINITRFENIPQPLLDYRVHGNQISTTANQKQFSTVKKILNENLVFYFGEEIIQNEKEYFQLLKLHPFSKIDFPKVFLFAQKLKKLNKQKNQFNHPILKKKINKKLSKLISL